MNYKWLVVFTLKSGRDIEVIYEGPENNSSDVAKKIVEGGNYNMNGFNDVTKTHNILVLVGEIAAMDISQWRG